MGGGGSAAISPNDSWARGPQISQNSETYYLNDPLRKRTKLIFEFIFVFLFASFKGLFKLNKPYRAKHEK
jgi:hypothetical protein